MSNLLWSYRHHTFKLQTWFSASLQNVYMNYQVGKSLDIRSTIYQYEDRKTLNVDKMTCPRKLLHAVCGPGDLASDHPLATAAVKDVSWKTVSGGGAEQLRSWAAEERSVMRAWAHCAVWALAGGGHITDCCSRVSWPVSTSIIRPRIEHRQYRHKQY